MKKLMISFLWAAGILAAIVFAGVLALFIYLSATEYKPRPVKECAFTGPVPEKLPDRKFFSCMSWNIGYAGLGREMDFFYEGGTKVRPVEKEYQRYLDGILKQIRNADTCDFILLQEVDRDSKRSYRTDQVATIASLLPRYGYSFASNYESAFIPVPTCSPMGKVQSGIASFSRFRPIESKRYSYDAQFPWPKRLGLLKRCYLVYRIQVDTGKYLVLINIHNSTYDENGYIRARELDQLSGFAEKEYKSGNYVVIGGDWNMNPKGFAANAIESSDSVHVVTPPLKPDFLKGWTFAYDPSAPSNRDVDMPYIRGKTGTTLIDFFALSPNVELLKIKAVHLGFEHSDHNPVYMTFDLR